MSETAVFTARDGRIVASALGRGPWDPNALHGGAPAALLMRAFEGQPAAPGLAISRVTYEFLRPIPLGELSVRAEVIRPGRRVQLLEASILAPGNVEVARARALQVRRSDPSVPKAPGPPPPPGPDEGRTNDFPYRYRPMFTPDAVEIRFVEGAFLDGGPAIGWFRLRVPIVAGEEPSQLQRLAAAGDFGNGISSTLPWEDFVFINPDLTLYIDREPEGEWICLEARTFIPPGGIGTAEAVLYDQSGRVGRAIQALFVAPR